MKSDQGGEAAILGEGAGDARRVVICLAVTAWVILAVVSARLPLQLAGLFTVAGGQGVTSGVWATLATDFADGMMYRPLVSNAGYGGTRYFPLGFIVHGLLIRAGLSPLAAGHLASLLAMVFLLAGMYRLMRNHGVAPLTAACVAAFLLPTAEAQTALLTIRGDALPAALNMWGLALATGHRPRPAAAGSLFALAFLAKVSTVFGALAVVVAWIRCGETRRVRTLILWGLGMTCVCGATLYVSSGGRWLESFRACASGGGSWRSLLDAPELMLTLPTRLDLALVLVGVAVAVAGSKEERGSVPALTFMISLGIVFVLFGSPGVTGNHLLDVHAAALVMFAIYLRKSAGAFFAATLVCLLTLFGVGIEMNGPRASADTLRRVLVGLPMTGGPLLSENPWIPILTGERPYVLDAFSLRLLTENDPNMLRDFQEKLAGKYFRAVVLRHNVASLNPTAWGPLYTSVHFGREFPDALSSNYKLVYDRDNYFVYIPK